jgi:hypothetical protein
VKFDKDVYYRYKDGVSLYNIRYKGFDFQGTAVCHDEDLDMESERVGLSIAESRATVKVLKFIRDNEIKPQLKILEHLYSNMKTSKFYNSNSYEAKMVRKQLGNIKKELTTINNTIADEKKFLKDYIDGKEKLYQRLRAKKQ